MPKSPNDKPVGEDEFSLIFWLVPGVVMLILAAAVALISYA